MIFVGYRRQVGRVDVEGVAEFIKSKNIYSKVYILHISPLHPSIKELIDKYGFFEILTTNFKKEIARLKKEDKVDAYDLNDFGGRSMRSPCGGG